MKNLAVSLVIALSVLVLSVACSTPNVPSGPPVPATPAPASPSTSNLMPPTSQEASWNAVIEAAKKEGKVNLYSFNLVGDIGIAVGKAFKDKYGITVDIITGRGAEILERVKTEKRLGNLTADIHDGSSVFTTSMKTEGLTISVADQLPVFRETAVWRANVFGLDIKDKHIAALSVYYQSPWINTRLIAPKDAPQMWRDLLKPEWKGKMILTDPTTSGGPQQFFVPLIREKVVDEEYLKALYQQDLLFATSLQDEARVLARGERPISIRGTVATYSRFAVEGAPIRAIDIKDGVVQVLSPTLVIFGGGPHPNATKLYYNWFMSAEGQGVWTKSASITSIRSDVPDSAPEASWITPQRPVLQTMEDNDRAAQLFKDRWPNTLWGRR